MQARLRTTRLGLANAGRSPVWFAMNSWSWGSHMFRASAGNTTCIAAGAAALVAVLATGVHGRAPVKCTKQDDVAAQCPPSILGVWSQDMSACESMGPFLEGLGVPWFVWPIVDQLHTALHITSPAPGSLQIVDQTLFGVNTTRVELDGSEVEKKTRGGRKSFMLSGCVTRSPVEPLEASGGCAVIACRLFQRGEGWSTRMERYAEGGRLVERNVLTRPGQQDVVVVRHFVRAEETPAEVRSSSSSPTVPARAVSRTVASLQAVGGSGKQGGRHDSTDEAKLAMNATDTLHEVAEVTRQRREWIGLCGAVVASGTYGCVRACRSRGG